jgi:hypothetical protein
VPLRSRGVLQMENLEEPRSEIVRLLQEQLDVIERVTVTRLTEEEWSEYDKRRERIGELQANLDQSKIAA